MKIEIEVSENYLLDLTEQTIIRKRLLKAIYSTIFKFRKDIILTEYKWDRL